MTVTVHLREETLTVSDAFRILGLGSTPSSAVAIDAEPEQSPVSPIEKGKAEKNVAFVENDSESKSRPDSPGTGLFEAQWYDRPIVLIPVLIGVFPMGLYGLYRTGRFSTVTKLLFIVGWLAVTLVWVLFLYGRI